MLGKLLRNSAFRIGLLLLVTQVSTTVAAEGLESTGLRLVSERPNPSGEATLITVGILIFDIDEVDDVSQRFSVDMFTTLAWHDPRLALSEDQRFGRSRSLPLDEIWTPRGLIVNDRGLSAQLPRSANIDDLGNVVYRQRLSSRSTRSDCRSISYRMSIPRMRYVSQSTLIFAVMPGHSAPRDGE
jgi:hypothetical protein